MIEIAPSILNANLADLGSEVRKIGHADWLHFDVMDGHFVPNLTFGPMFVSTLKRVTSLPVEAHLMAQNPEKLIPLYIHEGSNRIIIHAESTLHLHRMVQLIKENGCQAGVALNPATPLSMVEYILSEVDVILLMTVNPGFGGQKLIPQVIPKIKKLQQMIADYNSSCKIEVDGGVNWDNLNSLIEAGANIIVAGTLVFRDPSPETVVARLKTQIG